MVQGAKKVIASNKKGNKMKKFNTVITVAITLAVVFAVSSVAYIAYSKGVSTGEANQINLQRTIEKAMSKAQ